MFWLNLFLGMSESAVTAVCAWYFMSQTGQTIHRRRAEYAVAFILYAVLGFVCTILRIGMVFPFIFILLTACFLFSREKVYLCYCGVYYLCIYACQGAIVMGMLHLYPVYSMMHPYEAGNIMIVVKCIAAALLTRVFIFLVKRNEEEGVSRVLYPGIFLLPVFSSLYIYSLVITGEVYTQLNGSGLLALNIAAVLVMNIYMVYLFFHVSRTSRLQNEVRLLEQKSEMQLRYYEEMEYKYQESRKLVHDMRNHLLAIEELYGSAEDKGSTYVRDLHQMLNQLGQQYYTNNKMLNIILNEKVRRAKQKDIRTDIRIGDICLEKMRDIDITTIFANLIDNALEAAQEAEGERFVEIRADRFHDFHIIKIKNSKSRNHQKPGHSGIGLQNVEKALKKYDGMMEITEEDHVYQAVITIPRIGEEETK